jgi:hypothetical protein
MYPSAPLQGRDGLKAVLLRPLLQSAPQFVMYRMCLCLPGVRSLHASHTVQLAAATDLQNN